MKEFMNERVERVGNVVDGDGSIPRAVPSNDAALGMKFKDWPLEYPAVGQLIVNISDRGHGRECSKTGIQELCQLALHSSFMPHYAA